MSDFYDARESSPALRAATRAFVDALLEAILADLQLAARGCGYALAVHGSRSRDLDLLAVPWTNQAQGAEFLVDRLCGALAGKFGRAVAVGEWVEKPHGRRAIHITLPAAITPEIDLSVMPLLAKEKSK